MSHPPPSSPFWPRPGGMRPVDRDLHCPHCGYNLRGVASGTCPECGRPFDPDLMSTPGLPWPQRHTRGRLDAFISTAILVIFHPRKYTAEMWETGHLSSRDARLFRRLCILLAAIPFCAAWLAALPAYVAPKAPVLGALTGLLMIPLWLEWCSTRLPKLMGKQTMNKDRHRRIVVLAHYTAAPLALTPAVALLLIGAAVLYTATPPPHQPLVITAAATLLLSFLALWQLSSVLFLYHTMDVNPGEALALFLASTLGFLTRTAICLALVPALVRWWTDRNY